MAEIGELCNVRLDRKTIYRITHIEKIPSNVIVDNVQKISVSYLVDVEENENPNNTIAKIPIYDIHLIK